MARNGASGEARINGLLAMAVVSSWISQLVVPCGLDIYISKY
jgi:hypothetical protein